MRKAAFFVGCWCGSWQLGLIYSLAFLWSATAMTVVYNLIVWFAGTLLGLQQKLSPARWSWLLPLCVAIFVYLYPSLPAQILLISSFLCGMIAGIWFLGIEPNFVKILRWESLGTGVGYLVTGLLVMFYGLNKLFIWLILLSCLLSWKERKWFLTNTEASP